MTPPGSQSYRKALEEKKPVEAKAAAPKLARPGCPPPANKKKKADQGVNANR